MTHPTCGKCGGEMTRENARLRPELFLHDACLPDELKPPAVSRCKHENFNALVNVQRIEGGEGGPVTRFMADVTVWCTACLTKFSFVGLPHGLDMNGAAVSVDGTEARLTIAPPGEVMTMLEGVTGFTAKRTK